METCNVENMTKWIEALESGKYKQGEGRLRNNNDEFCCVGVGLDLFDPSRWERNVYNENNYTYNGMDFVDTHYSSPWSLRYWLGIEDFPIENEKDVYDWNDDGMTFQDIAKKLREIYLTPES